MVSLSRVKEGRVVLALLLLASLLLTIFFHELLVAPAATPVGNNISPGVAVDADDIDKSVWSFWSDAFRPQHPYRFLRTLGW